MQNGENDIIYRAERAVKNMAACGLSHSAKDIKDLIRYTRALDKNQKVLIKYLVDTRKKVEIWEKVLELVKTWLTPAQMKYAHEFVQKLKKEVMPDDAT